MHVKNRSTKKVVLAAAAANVSLIGLAGLPQAHAENFIATSGAATWNANGSWVENSIPNGVGAVAIFPAITAARNTPLDNNITVGDITINNSAAGTPQTDIAQGTSVTGLTFDGTGGAGTISTVTVNGTGNGQNRITADMVVNDELQITVNNLVTTTTGAFSLLGRVSGAGGVTKMGDGLMTWAFTPSTTDRFKTYTGATRILGGRVRMSSGAAPSGTTGLEITNAQWVDTSGTATMTIGNGTVPITLSGTGPLTGPWAAFPGLIRPSTNAQITWVNPITLAGDSLIHANGSVSGAIVFPNVVSGPGKLILNQAAGDGNNGFYFLQNTGNLYAGGTTINGGTLDATAGNLGATTGALTVNSQTQASPSTTLVKLNTSSPTTVGPLSGSKNGVGGSSITVDNGGQLLTVNQTAAGTYEGTIIGAGGLTLGALSNNTLTLAGQPSYTGNTTVNAGKLVWGTSFVSPAALNVTGGVAELALGNNKALNVASATITGTGQLDIENNKMIVQFGTNPSPLTATRAAIIAGRGGTDFGNATWQGTGGISSDAAAIGGFGDGTNAGDGVSFAVGYVENSFLPSLGLPSYTEFGGQTVDSGSMLIRFTRGADCNLDGKVNTDDVTIVGATFGTTNAEWSFGDFDYDGVVDSDDVTVLGALYDATAPALSQAQLSSQFGGEFAAAFARGQAMAAVPEPTSLSLLGIGALAALKRRRRSSR